MTHCWQWLSFVHSWRPCRSTELMKHYHHDSVLCILEDCAVLQSSWSTTIMTQCCAFLKTVLFYRAHKALPSWLSVVHSWRSCCSTELMKHYRHDSVWCILEDHAVLQSSWSTTIMTRCCAFLKTVLFYRAHEALTSRLSVVHSWRLCCSTELMKHYHHELQADLKSLLCFKVTWTSCQHSITIACWYPFSPPSKSISIQTWPLHWNCTIESLLWSHWCTWL